MRHILSNIKQINLYQRNTCKCIVLVYKDKHGLHTVPQILNNRCYRDSHLRLINKQILQLNYKPIYYETH